MRIGILGAGSIGCHVGGMLADAGVAVVLVGRSELGEALREGIDLTAHDGAHKHAAPGQFVYATEASMLAECDVVLVCVKSGDTAEAGEALAPHLKDGATIVSLQNGVGNVAVLRRALPGRTVLAAMVGFNVARIGANRFHRGTEGEIVLQEHKAMQALARELRRSGLPAGLRTDIDAVQYGKLLMNLNNGLNALSGMPLKRQLASRAWRSVLADCIAEGLEAMKAAGIHPAKVARVSPGMMPFVLRLPDFVFVRLASSMLKIDDNARSSMAEDLEKGRQPEIDWLNGEVVRLGKKSGVPTPVNAAVVAEVNALFAHRDALRPGDDAVLARLTKAE